MVNKNINSIKLNFGIPLHGWVETYFEFQDFTLELMVSNVPNNPIYDLSYSLNQMLLGNNEPNVVILHQEPYTNYFQIKKINQSYEITVLESYDYDNPNKKIMKIIQGSFKEVVLPLYRAIKKFNSYSYKKPNWSPINQKEINQLTNLIKLEKSKF